jgi:hypothetical protein
MRLFHVLPALSLLLEARASSLDSRQPGPHPLDARDLSDVCAPLEGEFMVSNGQGLKVDFGAIGESAFSSFKVLSYHLHCREWFLK